MIILLWNVVTFFPLEIPYFTKWKQYWWSLHFGVVCIFFFKNEIESISSIMATAYGIKIKRYCAYKQKYILMKSHGN